MMERYPFLARYVKHPSIWNLYLEPVEVDLAWKHPEIRGSWRCPCKIRIVLLDANGDEIGFVGQRSRIIPASKFFRWTIRPAEKIAEEFHETVQQALQRFGTPASWVLVISEQGMAGGYHATMFFPPDGQSVNECLKRMLEKKQQAEAARSVERALRMQQQEAAELARQRSLLKDKLKSTQT